VKSNLASECFASKINHAKVCMVSIKYLLQTKIKFHRPIVDFLGPDIFKGRDEWRYGTSRIVAA